MNSKQRYIPRFHSNQVGGEGGTFTICKIYGGSFLTNYDEVGGAKILMR